MLRGAWVVWADVVEKIECMERKRTRVKSPTINGGR